MKNLLLFTFVLLTVKISAQAPAMEWQKSLGGSNDDVAKDIIETTDGGFIIAGHTQSINGDVSRPLGDVDAWIVKLSAQGNLEWEKTYGGSENDGANSILQTSDGGYIFAGWSSSIDGDIIYNHGENDLWVVKTTEMGEIQWQKTYGGSWSERANSISPTQDGGFIIAGMSNSIDGDVTTNQGFKDCWIIKIDQNGNLEWEKSFGGSDYDNAMTIHQTWDLGYIIACYTLSSDGDVINNHGSSDYWILKLDEYGGLQWQKTLGGYSSEDVSDIMETTDGGFIVSGYSFSSDGDISNNYGASDFWIVKLDNSGFIEWEKSFGGSDWDLAYSLKQTLDGGYVITGASRSNNGDVTHNNGNMDLWVIKLSSDGILQWQKSFGGSGNDAAYSIQQTSNGGYIMCGESDSNDGDVSQNHGSSDYWIVKLSPETIGIEEISTTQNIKFYPVPVQNLLTIEEIQPNSEITLVNGLGQIIYKQMVKSPNETIDCSAMANGVYTLIVKSPDLSLSSYKIIK